MGRLPVIAVPIRRCVAPSAIASRKSADMPAEIAVGSGRDRPDAVGAARAARANARAGGSSERRDGHDAAQPQPGCRSDVLGERVELGGRRRRRGRGRR